jgi:drug/metabolite transporter (DMT)-like permease
VPASAFALALAAAFVHALWNILVARGRDAEAATAVALVVAVVAFAPVAALVWELDAAAAPYVAGTGAFHLLYFVLLGAAYRRAELSLVYPLARGLAPVGVLAVGVVALGAGTSAVQAAGVCLVGLGVVLVRGIRGDTDPVGVAFGLAIAGTIVGYTLVDNVGIEHGNPITYLEVSLVGPVALYAGGMLALKGRAALRAEVNAGMLVAGLATFGAYALVLAALQLASAAPVAAVRETSVVIATVGAALFLRERVGVERLLGAVLVAAGIALLGV